MQSASNPYRPPKMRNKTPKSEPVFTQNKVFDITTNTDLFPELSSNSKKNNTNPQQNQYSNNTKNFSHLIKDINQTEKEQNHETNKLLDGWIEITENDARKTLSSYRIKPKSDKPDFIQRIYNQERYIHSLSDKEYRHLCHKTMDNVVNIYKRQKMDFIQTHGYEYYNSIYGYEPVYHRRVIYKYIPKPFDTSYDSDNSQMSERYTEYYTDDDDELDIDSIKEDDTFVDEMEDDYND